MAKISFNPIGTQQASARPLASFNVQYSPEHFGAALAKGVASFAQAAEVIDTRKKETQRFDTLNNFVDFETNTKLQIEKLKQDTPENAANFFEQAEALYDNEQNNFLNKLPPELQDEFEYRANQVRQGVIYDAFKFNFDQQNLFYSNKINDQLNVEKIALEQLPETLERRRGTIHEMIDASGLTEIEKEKQKRLADAALEAISYKAAVRKTQKEYAGKNPAGVADTTLPAVTQGVLAVIKKRESGGRYDVRYSGKSEPIIITSFRDHPRAKVVITQGTHQGDVSSASGAYQFIEKTWDAAARGAGVNDFSPASQDKAAAYWAAKTVQETTGRTMEEVVAAKDWGTLKKALGAQWSGVKNMSLKEIEETFSSAGGAETAVNELEANPSFANLSLEERDVIKKDAIREAQIEYNQLLEQQRNVESSKINDLMVGLLDGNKGLADITALRNEGILRDYEDINKAQGIIAKREGDVEVQRAAETKFVEGGTWAFDNADDRKAANALLGKSGYEAINKRDAAYVEQTFLPQYQKMGMASPDSIDLLSAMTRHSDQANAVFAYSVLERMREAHPMAFEAQMSKELQAQVDAWTASKNTMDPTALVDRVQNRAPDYATRQAQTQMRTEAKTLLTSPDYNIKEKATATFDKYWDSYGGELPMAPGARTQLLRDFSSVFEENYVRYNGDEALAREATQKHLERIWALSDIGGNKSLRRFPPEKAGYMAYNGDFTWIDRAVRTELQFSPETTFELHADTITEQEIFKRERGELDPKTGRLVEPSYLIWFRDENGVTGLSRQPTGEFSRINFQPLPEDLERHEKSFFDKQRQVDEDYILQKAADESLEFREKGGLVYKQGDIPDSPLQREAQKVLKDREERKRAERLKAVEDYQRETPPEAVILP